MKKLNSKCNFLWILVVVCAALVSCSEKHEQVGSEEKKDPAEISLTTEQLKKIKVDTARAVAEETELSLTGKVSFDENKVAKVFPLVSGNVVKVNVSLGDYVTKGQVIATLRSADINDFQNQYQIAQSNLQVAKKNLDIANELYKTNVNSEKDYLSAQNDYKRAEAETNKLKQQLSIYGATDTGSDAEYKIVAPIDGYIVEKNVNENMEIRSDNANNIFTVSSLNTVWVLADVYETDLAKIKIGDEATITTIAYPDKIFKGTISQISNLLDPVSRVLKIRIVLDNPGALLKPEMYANVKVHITKPIKVIAVPTKSLVFDNNKFHVIVRDKDGKNFHSRVVQLIHNTAEIAYIRDGLTDGELVISEGSLLAAFNSNN